MPIHESDLQQQNLGVIRKNNRGPVRQKPGRKRPRPGDVSVNIPNKIQQLEQTEQMEQPEHIRQHKQTEQQEGLPEQMEHQNTEQLQKTEQELKKRERSLEALERTVNHILSAKGEGSQENDALLAKALKELESSVNELIEDFESHKQADQQEDIGQTQQPESISFDNILSSTPNTQLKKDIHYSLEVWVPADKLKLFHNLNMHERNILKSKKEWLNDVIIDSAMNLLQYQFPDLEGFQSCHLAYQLDFQRHDNLFIQIINRSPGGGGSHWLTVSNINCRQDEVGVYDSAFEDLPHMEELVVTSLVKVRSKVLKVKFPKVAQQTNGNDCGLYAIANATALAHGLDPSTQVYIPREMRDHLFMCLENRHLEPFPVTKGSNSRRKVIKKTIPVPIFCVCKMPDTRTLYVICDVCNEEYHPECIGLDRSLNESFMCKACMSKSA